MSSAENFEIRPVHVLRHRFEMSTRLTKKTMEILGLESDRFQVFGTKQVAVSATDYYGSQLDTKIGGATDTFRDDKRTIGLNGKMSIKSGERNWSYIALQVARQQEFDALLAGLDSLPDLNTKKILTNHYLTFRVASNGLLRSAEGREGAIAEFQEAIPDVYSAHLYTVAALDITGFDSTLVFPIEGEKDVLQDAS